MLTMDKKTSPAPGDTIPGLDARIGPWLVATLLHSVETGIIIGQAITFLSYTSARAPGRSRGVRERRLVKTVALFVLLIAVLQTSSSVWNSWDTLVRNFGNAYEAIQVSWVMKSQQMINVLLAVPVQAFLIWRCWLTMNRNPYILSGLITLVLASLAMSTYVTFRIFKGMSEIVSEVSSELLIVNPYDPFYILSLILPTMLDVLLTGILFTYFFRSRNIVISRHFRKILSSLMVVIWEAALPPCVCSIITTIMYFDKRQSSFWNLMFQEVLGQLYVISFFVTVYVPHSAPLQPPRTVLSASVFLSIY
ncbi:hypothetical protein DFH11DRAFT_1237358 [Phellopilus nigrolimitatus]|nr:hypothetical protein DFH11DRAFT_1237358 [Phellopilus nigrolimitatus]